MTCQGHKQPHHTPPPAHQCDRPGRRDWAGLLHGGGGAGERGGAGGDLEGGAGLGGGASLLGPEPQRSPRHRHQDRLSAGPPSWCQAGAGQLQRRYLSQDYILQHVNTSNPTINFY